MRYYGGIMFDKVKKLKAEKLFWAIGYAIKSPIYYKDSIGRGETYCNITAYDFFDSRTKAVWTNSVKVGESLRIDYDMGNIIQAYDYDLSPIMPGKDINNILNAPIPIVYDNCINENGKTTRLLNPVQAQKLADSGIPTMIISKTFDHVAITCPNLKWDVSAGKMIFQKYDSKKGVFTGNAGENNDYMFMSDKRGFGAVDWKSPEILYVQFKLFGSNVF
jgi:hypothetical protein